MNSAAGDRSRCINNSEAKLFPMSSCRCSIVAFSLEVMSGSQFLKWFGNLNTSDIALVGGKNASLGEMTGALSGRGVKVPDGLSVTAAAYRLFPESNRLVEPMREELARIGADESFLPVAGREIRRRILEGTIPSGVETAILEAYRELGQRHGVELADVAVRCCATAGDLPGASLAGQQETYLNVQGESLRPGTERLSGIR